MQDKRIPTALFTASYCKQTDDSFSSIVQIAELSEFDFKFESLFETRDGTGRAIHKGTVYIAVFLESGVR